MPQFWDEVIGGSTNTTVSDDVVKKAADYIEDFITGGYSIHFPSSE